MDQKQLHTVKHHSISPRIIREYKNPEFNIENNESNVLDVACMQKNNKESIDSSSRETEIIKQLTIEKKTLNQKIKDLENVLLEKDGAIQFFQEENYQLKQDNEHMFNNKERK